MRKTGKITLLWAVGLALLLWASTGKTADDAKLLVTWTAPTTMGDICTSTTPITGAWAYTVQHRIKGATNWNSTEIAVTSLLISSLTYSTDYEVRVGSHRLNEPVLCWTEIVTQRTKSAPAPGGCTSLSVVAQ